MAAVTPSAITDAVHDTAYQNTVEWGWYVNDADNGETIATGIGGLRRVAWAGSTAAAGGRVAPIHVAGTGVVTMHSGGNGRSGLLIGWGPPNASRTGTTTADSVDAPGLPLRVQDGIGGTGGGSGALACRRRVFPFAAVADGDTWASGIRGIQLVAWQPTLSTDICCVTWDAATGILTFNNGVATDGNVIVWSRS